MKTKRFALLVLAILFITGYGMVSATQTASAAKKAKTTSTEESGKENTKATKKKDTKKKTAKKKYNKKELRIMTSIIYAEAGDQSYAGKLAVGIVIMNRKRSSEFPNSVKGVVYQSGQFSPVRNGALRAAYKLYDKGYFDKKKAYKDCKKAAIAALEGAKTIKVKGKEKKFSRYYFFSQYLSNAKYTLGDHMFK